MFDAEIKSIALFFFFSFLDERRALLASTQATDLFYHKMKTAPQMRPDVAVVSVTRQVWEKMREDQHRGPSTPAAESGWRMPGDADLSPWREFQKHACKNVSQDELLAVIWSQILKISDPDISAGIGVAVGTLRYRIGHGMCRLGGMIKNSRASRSRTAESLVSQSIAFSKMGERKLSGFMAQELMYDYVTGKLDAERSQAVEAWINASAWPESEIHSIQSSLAYCQVLSETKVSDVLLEEMKAPSSYFQVLLRKLRLEDWSPRVKTGLEVLVVTLGVIAVSLIVPWHRVMDIHLSGSQEVVLAEVDKSPSGKGPEEVSAPAAEAQGDHETSAREKR